MNQLDRWILLGLLGFLAIVWLWDWKDRRNGRSDPPRE